MRIKLDDKHYLNSDAYQYWISVELKSETGKLYDRVVSGYYRNPQDVIDSYIDRKVGNSEAESIAELFEEVKELKNQVTSWKTKVEVK